MCVIDFSHGARAWTKTQKGVQVERASKKKKKCAQQGPSLFSSCLLWPGPHFLNCHCLSGTIYTHQSQGLSYLFYLLSPPRPPPLSLCFCFLSYCQVFKRPAGLIELPEWSWWTRDSMGSMWPMWPKAPLCTAALCCFVFVCLGGKRRKGALHWVGGYQLALWRHSRADFIRWESNTAINNNLWPLWIEKWKGFNCWSEEHRGVQTLARAAIGDP